MRKLWLPLALAAFLAASGDAAAAQAKPTASPKCAITKLSVNSSTGAVTATGHCLLKKKRVPVKWSFAYRAYDHDGYACGSGLTQGKTRSFKIQPMGAYRALGKVTLQPRTGKGMKAARVFRTTLEGENLQCGRLVNLPAPATLCPWADPWPGMMPFNNCGVSNRLVGWKTPPRLDGNVVTAGHVVSRSGTCRMTTDRLGIYWAPPAADWLGFRQQAQHMECADGSYVRVSTGYVGLINPAGRTCSGGPPIGGLRIFRIPPDWGGKLYVQFFMGVVSNFRGERKNQEAFVTTQTAIFNLRGTEDGCPLLTGRE